MIDTLLRYEELGLVYKQVHPELPISIWNYTEKVQWEGLWNQITLQCRGLVVQNTTGKVLARPFKKFFNLSEGKTDVSGQDNQFYPVMQGGKWSEIVDTVEETQFQPGTLGAFWDGEWEKAVDEGKVFVGYFKENKSGRYYAKECSWDYDNFKPLKFLDEK